MIIDLRETHTKTEGPGLRVGHPILVNGKRAVFVARIKHPVKDGLMKEHWIVAIDDKLKLVLPSEVDTTVRGSIRPVAFLETTREVVDWVADTCGVGYSNEDEAVIRNLKSFIADAIHILGPVDSGLLDIDTFVFMIELEHLDRIGINEVVVSEE